MCTMIKEEDDIKEIGSETTDREIQEVRKSVNRQYKTNLTKVELRGKKHYKIPTRCSCQQKRGVSWWLWTNVKTKGVNRVMNIK